MDYFKFLKQRLKVSSCVVRGPKGNKGDKGDKGDPGAVQSVNGITPSPNTGDVAMSADKVPYQSESEIYGGDQPGYVSEALAGLENYAVQAGADIASALQDVQRTLYYTGTIDTSKSTVTDQTAQAHLFLPYAAPKSVFIDKDGNIGQIRSVSNGTVTFRYTGGSVIPKDPIFSSATLLTDGAGVSLYGEQTQAGGPVLELTDTGDGDQPVRIMNVADPQAYNEATNKNYVDTLFSSQHKMVFYNGDISETAGDTDAHATSTFFPQSVSVGDAVLGTNGCLGTITQQLTPTMWVIQSTGVKLS